MSESETTPVTAALIIIGNEILSGRTVDANLPHIAKRLNEWGIQMREVRVVADVEAEIIEAVNACRAKHRYVFTTGGIGPTHDDITAAAIAKAFGRKYERNAEAERRLLAYYPPEKVNEARMKMADMPEGVALIDNPVSTAPGFIIENVHVLPGVPKIMQAMFEELRNALEGGEVVKSRTLVCFRPEGELAQPLGEIQSRCPEIDIGSYPFFRVGRFGTSVVFRGVDEDALGRAYEALVAYAEGEGIETERVAFS